MSLSALQQRIRQQAILAGLGVSALQGATLDKLLEDTRRAVPCLALGRYFRIIVCSKSIGRDDAPDRKFDPLRHHGAAPREPAILRGRLDAADFWRRGSPALLARRRSRSRHRLSDPRCQLGHLCLGAGRGKRHRDPSRI
ncbi:MAG: hypothetical protein EBY17_29755 [Acidobacteriia bacterium]|nr:hypothetical protein [Terriglobia bacterium]